MGARTDCVCTVVSVPPQGPCRASRMLRRPRGGPMTTHTTTTKGLTAASRFAFTKDGELRPQAQTLLGRALSVQRPVVLAYVRSVRRRHPHASPAQIAEILRKHYVTLAMGGGAAVGATAVVPGIGIGAALGLAAVETGGFLELSALYSQSLAELHGMQVREPKRANALVMGLMLGGSGKDLVRQFSDQIDGGPPVHSNFGALVTKQIPSVVMDRSEEHTSELQSRGHLVCRLLLAKNK